MIESTPVPILFSSLRHYCAPLPHSVMTVGCYNVLSSVVSVELVPLGGHLSGARPVADQWGNQSSRGAATGTV